MVTMAPRERFDDWNVMDEGSEAQRWLGLVHVMRWWQARMGTRVHNKKSKSSDNMY